MYCVHRGLPAGIHETYNYELCHFVADNCRANIIVVENQEQVDKILKVSYHVLDVAMKLTESCVYRACMSTCICIVLQLIC